ncbi:hypothetical protein J6590_063670 [Homalodisca vitripennis]|nr:hypothetical protein J6590_063670 [Homalodisca vitripennis]
MATCSTPASPYHLSVNNTKVILFYGQYQVHGVLSVGQLVLSYVSIRNKQRHSYRVSREVQLLTHGNLFDTGISLPPEYNVRITESLVSDK